MSTNSNFPKVVKVYRRGRKNARVLLDNGLTALVDSARAAFLVDYCLRPCYAKDHKYDVKVAHVTPSTWATA